VFLLFFAASGEGLFIREFTNGYAAYNRSSAPQIISLGDALMAVPTGNVAIPS
jgi:hypothetical protein